MIMQRSPGYSVLCLHAHLHFSSMYLKWGQIKWQGHHGINVIIDMLLVNSNSTLCFSLTTSVVKCRCVTIRNKRHFLC